MAAPLSRWSDDRLDDLSHRVRDMEPTVNRVGELRVEMLGLARQLEENTKATKNVGEQLEQAKMEPLTRGRTFRSQLTIAICGALAGGGLAILGAAIGHG